jgi:hypothetical protein
MKAEVLQMVEVSPHRYSRNGEEDQPTKASRQGFGCHRVGSTRAYRRGFQRSPHARSTLAPRSPNPTLTQPNAHPTQRSPNPTLAQRSCASSSAMLKRHNGTPCKMVTCRGQDAHGTRVWVVVHPYLAGAYRRGMEPGTRLTLAYCSRTCAATAVRTRFALRPSMAIKFYQIEPGMTLLDIHSVAVGNSSLRQLGCWEVLGISVDKEQMRAMVKSRSTWCIVRVIDGDLLTFCYSSPDKKQGAPS